MSTDEQARSGYSLAQQIEALRDYAAREGHEVAEEVLDPGQSGASLERPGMDQVRDLVAAGGVSVVLAQDRDRFAREPAYLYLLKTEFAEYGTQLRAFNDRGDDSPEGEFFDGVLDQLAKLERAKLTERSRRGKFQKVRQGKLLAAAPRPRYGFRYNASRDGYEVDVETMTVVRRILRMFGEGASIHGVRDALEREGVPAPSGGRRWSRTTVKNIVLDDCYRPHTIEELETLVTREVVARLEPGKLYGVSWWGRRRTSIKQVSENVPEGRRYRRSARR
ncbi:MAG TPA: recombinase family protein [Rubrobacteraceae bacterium]